MVIAPHPDDETLGCGGTIKLLTQSDVAVDVVYLTLGELGFDCGEEGTPAERRRLGAIRAVEAREACDVLGVRHVHFLPGNDGQLSQQGHLADSLAALLRTEPYRRLFCPWSGEGHVDHRATFSLVRQALSRSPSQGPAVWLYEIWTPLRPTAYVPIELTIGFKQAAIERHRSQLQVRDYRTAVLGLAAYRALICPPAKYAEAFVVCDFDELWTLEGPAAS